ncbi:hypothetical protein [Dongia sedimenti]|uniref:DUF1127 domain-containing protein n=1 Tax=Dongia sedimenti TaxID=3064282 RepID=A0ABU0YHG2_9PROT|nr:hypothetical protein [Rhodospirillaceae bacterium R-7]
MALYLSFLNLIGATPGFIDRLTTALRRDRHRRPRPIMLSQSGQAPPRSLGRRFQHELWRYRVQSIRPTDLSPHLRRDIGLDS